MRTLSILLLSIGILFIISETSFAQNWSEVTMLTSSNPESDSRYGDKVAISGDFAVVSSKFANNNVGTVTVYMRQGAEWIENQILEAPNTSWFDNFGTSVAIYDNIIVVGAPEEDEDENDENTIVGSGSVYVFELQNNVWEFQQKLVASDRTMFDKFGFDVAIFENIILVGSPGEDDDVNNENSLNEAGSAYIFNRIDDNWVEAQKIVSEDRAEFDAFGSSVSVFGEYIAIGSPWEDEDATNENTLSSAGSVYVFEQQLNGWGEIQKVVAADRESFSEFGGDVALYEDYFVVGASKSNVYTGASYVFNLENEIWSEQQKLVASDQEYTDYFGISVAIEGEYIVIGAYLEDEDGDGENTLEAAGSAYIFKREGESWNEWQKIAPVQSERGVGQHFGFSVAFSEMNILVGAPRYSLEEDFSIGAAFLFDVCGNLSINVETTQTVCEGTSITLVAESSSGVVNWYTNEEDTQPEFVGAEYTTPELSENTSYWVEVVDNGCASNRVEVVITVNPAPVLIIENTEVDICEGQTALLNGTSTDNQVLWFENELADEYLYDGSNFNTPILIETTSFWVEAHNNTTGCSSQRTEILVNVNPVPPAPSAESSQVIPEGGTLMDLEVENTGQLIWYEDFELNNSISNTAQPADGSTLYVTQIVNGCESEATAITVNFILDLIEPGDQGISWYPNPTQNFIYLESETNNIVSIELLSATGKLIWSALSINALKTNIDMAAFPSGLYIATMTTTKGKYCFKVIKN